MTDQRLDWSAIRPLNGARAAGFEELCAQLARAECPAGSRFERKGTPDGGVECYAVLSDGSEWGWQAKYFSTLGDSQWPQLDKSVETALDKHPRLVRYIVCIPLDRPDPRIDGRQSAKDRWDTHVTKWTGWATDRGMSVDFVYWGSSELLERLTRPEHIGRVRFWFDVRGFDDAWFSARLHEAVRSAGPRYTPEIHVDLPVAAELDAFGRTEAFFNRIKAHARGIRDRRRTFGYAATRVEDPDLDAAVNELSANVDAVVSALGAIKAAAIGPFPFAQIAKQVEDAETTAERVAGLLYEREQAQEKTSDDGTPSSRTAFRTNPFRDRRMHLAALSSELRTTRKVLTHADTVASHALMIVDGDAGTGKSHLLCDVARHRIENGRPTILLMGQRFMSNDAPWTQALQQLDLGALSAEELVGALEAAAQAAGSRALFMIDAINEGAGRTIWLDHLAAFLAHLERSEWIAVVLSVRSSYMEIVVPEEVRQHAVLVTHHGFADHEYDATRMFFGNYGLELPSTPLLAPEFRNPLFLKTLCSGLHAKGETRLPRGVHGITAVFELYLEAINQRLATSLGFHRKTPLVRQALDALASALVEAGERWLTLTRAQEIVNALLPGREFERSLYRGLVVEGILIEEAPWPGQTNREEIVLVSYERFADHLVAKVLLDRHLDEKSPSDSFSEGGSLTFLCNDKKYLTAGLLEALCVQVAERTGQELTTLAPKLMERWETGTAFRQSVVWRANTAFSDDTREVLHQLCCSDTDFEDTLDVLLTVATLPGHPLNATYLDSCLRCSAMPVRDAWWSKYLHSAWRDYQAVDRLVDWAASVKPQAVIDDETVDLCATALSWMLTTSNRYLRDRATSALVNLLTGRLGAVARLVERFADIDDPYVTERLYAVAYGTAMRSHDPVEVGALANAVYARVFAAGAPPVHILLRDYARGVIERALHIGADIDITEDLIRPPYGTPWPILPSEEDIKTLRSDWSKGSHDSREIEWSRNMIGDSVMHGDFARYVIGTKSSSTSPNWLSLTLDEQAWQPPERPEALLLALVDDLSSDELDAWNADEEAEKAVSEALRSFVEDWFARRDKDGATNAVVDSEIDELERELETACPADLAELTRKRDAASAALQAILTDEHTRRRDEILAAKKADGELRRPSRFDLGQVQRYILWRVFDLGWTIERFGYFDRFTIRDHGRDESKAERIGKKYQWIAYHEIMAMIADNFQYREWYREDDGPQSYDGPWQFHLRDIDPSCTLRASHEETSRDGYTPAWWGPIRYETWGSPDRPREWAFDCDDLPSVTGLLGVVNPGDSSRWLNAQGDFAWTKPVPADRDFTDVESRELWYSCTGYLIKADDAPAFMRWAEDVDFWGRSMPDPPSVHRMFLGEHGWAPASRYFQQQFFEDAGWTQPDHGCPAKIRNIAVEYVRGASPATG